MFVVIVHDLSLLFFSCESCCFEVISRVFVVIFWSICFWKFASLWLLDSLQSVWFSLLLFASVCIYFASAFVWLIHDLGVGWRYGGLTGRMWVQVGCKVCVAGGSGGVCWVLIWSSFTFFSSLTKRLSCYFAGAFPPTSFLHTSLHSLVFFFNCFWTVLNNSLTPSLKAFFFMFRSFFRSCGNNTLHTEVCVICDKLSYGTDVISMWFLESNQSLWLQIIPAVHLQLPETLFSNPV